MRKALFIGGTGTISTAITTLAAKSGWDMYVLNRGNRNHELPANVHTIHCEDVNNEENVRNILGDMTFDVVADFIGFVPEQLERDFRLFAGRTAQFMYISSASAYQKPLSDYRITESTPLLNPYWEYSRNKIACEEYLMKRYREDGFPITIIRPSHTYCERSVPLGIHGSNGSWQVILRMLAGKPVIVQGDGTSLWTMTSSEDFAKGFVGLMGNVHAIGETYQITSDETLTWNQIYRTIADALGVDYIPCYVPSDFLAATAPKKYDMEGNLLGDKANSVVFDNAKLKRAVPGLAMTIRFDQGVRRTLDYCMAHSDEQIPDPEFDQWCDRLVSVMKDAKEKMLTD